MAVSLITGKEIRQGLVEYGDWVFLGTQVGTSGATTTAIPDATRLKGLALPSTLFNNSIVRIASGAAAGERTYVDYLDPNSGILYVNTALSEALADGDEYEIWLKGIDPDIVDRLRDDCLQKFCSQWRVVAFAQVKDGDMEEPPTTAQVAIVSSTDAAPIAVTSAEHGLVTGASVTITGHLVNLGANGTFRVTVTSTTAFTLDGTLAPGLGAGGATGTVLCANGVPDWTVTGSAIRNKLQSTFPNAHSRQSLRVSHPTGASDWVVSARIDVQPTDQWFLEVPVSCFTTSSPEIGTTASVIVEDLTNTGPISLTGVATHIGRGPGMISVTFTIPTGCYQMELRLKSDTNSSTSIWGGFALHERGQRRFSLPDRVTTRKRVGTFYTTGRETASATANEQYKNAPFQSIERVQVGGQVEIYVNPSTGEFPMFYYERGYFERMSPAYFTTAHRLHGDMKSADIQKEYIISAVAARVAKFYLDKFGEEWQDDWIRASADFNYWEGQHGPEPKLISEVESELYIPQLNV